MRTTAERAKCVEIERTAKRERVDALPMVSAHVPHHTSTLVPHANGAIFMGTRYSQQLDSDGMVRGNTSAAGPDVALYTEQTLHRS